MEEFLLLDSTQLIVRAVIAVDPSPETDHVVLTEQEVVQANGSGGIDEIISLSVEVRHNLVAQLPEELMLKLLHPLQYLPH